MKTVRGSKKKKTTKSSQEIITLKQKEEGIKKIAKGWRKIFDAISDFVFILDRNFKIVEVNKAICDFLKKEPQDLIGKRCYEVIHGIDKPWPNCPSKKMFEIKKTTTEEISDPNLGVPLSITASPIFDNKGALIGAVHTAKNIAEQKKTEEALRESEEKFRKIFDSANDALIYLNGSGRILDVNRKAIEVFGGARKELLGKRFPEINIFSVREIPNLVKNFAEIIAGKEPRLSVSIKNKKGQDIILECSASLMKQDHKGINVMVVARDITEHKKAEQVLKQSEEKYKALVENATDFIFMIDRNNRVLSINKAGARLFRKKPEEIIGKSIFNLFPKQIATNYSKNLKKVFQTGKPQLSEPKMVIGKKELWLSASLSPLRDYKGKIVAAMGVSRDITERKKAEEKIRTEKKKLEAYIDSMADGVVILDTKGKVINVNKSYTKIFGREKNEVVGKLSFTTGDIPKREIPKTLLILKEIIKKGSIENRELSLLTKEKKEIPILFSANLVRDTAGKLTNIFAVFKNITERKKAERALIKEKEKLQTYLDTAGIIILIISPENKVLFMNKKGFEVLGYKGWEILGKDWPTNFVPEKNRADVRDIFEKLINDEGKQIEYFEIPILTKGGKERIITWHNTLLRDEQGKPQAILVAGADITELQQAKMDIEQFKELDRMKDEFLNIAAHELRTPLTSIIGLTEIIKEQKSSLSSPLPKYIDIVHNEGIRLAHIIKRMLTITRFESGKETVQIESFNLPTLISSLVPNLNAIAKKKKSRIATKIDKKNIVIKSDKEKITQIIYNLVDNAIKYGPEGQTITITVTKPEKNRVKVEVIDRGQGIAPELQEKLFTKFSQLEPSLTRSQEGTGLGLYICKLIIVALGGKIGVKSQLGKGSTFYFTLPIGKAIKKLQA